ncbi:MAG: UDP-N-acetylmuramoyl-L-alanyl-D-glutamate--2,6-diaminopimelate ligase [Acidimicrobiales bacterium]
MTLLLDEIDVLETAGDPSSVEVLGIEHDSRRVAPGDLFCCLPGGSADGHRHAPEAVARGAVGLVCEHLVTGLPPGRRGPVVQARVPAGAARPSMARLSAALYGHPARQLLMAGVTGTNGKTTVTHLLGAVLAHAGRATTVIGTLSGARTTPEANELQRLLADTRDRASGDAAAVVLEVSSHALVQSRVDTIHFDVAVFTNLSHDHLDFHGTMEDYFAAKSSLFTPERALRAVVWADDPWGRRLLDQVRIPAVAVRRRQAGDVVLEAGRTEFTWRQLRVHTALTGMLNVDNALVAAEAGVVLGIAPDVVAAGLAAAPPVPGRLELVTGARPGPGPSVLVDYAHTPAGLEAALGECRRLAGDGRVWIVFGCGGDRDRTKRPAMGEVADRLAERVVVTSDNPRSEDPRAIIDDVVAGIADAPGARTAGRLVVEPDRRAAIAEALAAAADGDVVLVAGKGHEPYQEVDGVRHRFDDRVVVTELLDRRRGR